VTHRGEDKRETANKTGVKKIEKSVLVCHGGGTQSSKRKKSNPENEAYAIVVIVMIGGQSTGENS